MKLSIESYSEELITSPACTQLRRWTQDIRDEATNAAFTTVVNCSPHWFARLFGAKPRQRMFVGVCFAWADSSGKRKGAKYRGYGTFEVEKDGTINQPDILWRIANLLEDRHRDTRREQQYDAAKRFVRLILQQHTGEELP